MPIIPLNKIISFSSEDPQYPARNLLSKESLKWRCLKSGESEAWIIFQLTQPIRITTIDIGNEHSAFVTVLVSRTGIGSNDFKELLLTSSFMTPPESKSSEMKNRVRFFNKAALVPDVVNERWLYIKLVCTQPFNRHVQYGLGFVKLHTDEDITPLVVEPKSMPATNVVEKSLFGKFSLRRESTDSEGESSLGFFQKWKNSSFNLDKPIANKPLSGISEKPVLKLTPRTSTSTSASKSVPENGLNRNRSRLFYDDEDDASNSRLERKMKVDEERDKLKQKSVPDKPLNGALKSKPKLDTSTDKFKDFIEDDPISSQNKNKKEERKIKNFYSAGDKIAHNKSRDEATRKNFSPKSSKSSDNSPKSRNESSSGSKRNSSHIRTPSSKRRKSNENRLKIYKKFNELLHGVSFVISGIQNPSRADLRQKAVEMGGKYKTDWNDSCTHLICAFRNTPKYNQVRGHGKIVSPDWITDCHSKQTRLPWRRYALDKKEWDKSESEDEILDIRLKSPELRCEEKIPEKLSDESPTKSLPIQINGNTDTISDPIENQYDEDSDIDRMGSELDTDDEIERIQNNQVKPGEVHSDHSAKSIYNRTTEEDESYSQRDKNLDRSVTPPVNRFFTGKRFFLTSNLGVVDRVKLERYINVYGGEMAERVSKANYVLSNTVLEGAPSDFNGQIVKPLWVYECNDMECLLPTIRYIL